MKEIVFYLCEVSNCVCDDLLQFNTRDKMAF